MGVYRYVQLRRLKRASWQLAFRESMPVTDIALGSVYEGPEAFARAFRKHTGQSPSEFRREPQWDPWNATCQPLSELRIQHMTPTYSRDQIRVVDFPATRVAVLEHRGDPRRLGASIRRFIEWRKANRLPPRISATFNIAYDDPGQTPPADFRFDLCAATERDIEPNDAGIVVKTIPAGRCAVIRHIGSDDHLATTVAYLYSEWLPGSGEEPRDFPLYFERVSFFPDVPEHEATTDIYLPIR
jgi:AraC family transcriptional regulator